MLHSLEKAVALGSSFLTVIAPKFCCWSSAVTALGAGSSYLAWIYPLRPYLWGLSFLMVGISFYQAYKPVKSSCSSCSDDTQTRLLRSKGFTWIVAVLVLVMFILSQTI